MSEGTRTPGRVVWRELMTTDVDRAKEFYGALFGWSFEDVDMGPEMPPYPIARLGDKQVAGIVRMPDGAAFPPHWTSYVSVEDANAVVERCQQHGGSIAFGPIDVEGVGRLGTLVDFAGASISFLQPSMEDPAPGIPKTGELCWETLSTTDLERAKAFYGALFGWTAQPGPGGSGFVLGVGPTMAEGVCDVQLAQGMPPMWVTYVAVEDLEAARQRSAELGGQVRVPLIEVPHVGRIAFVTDPTGGAIGLFQPTRA